MITAISENQLVKVEWTYIGEGVCGDFDETDPNDIALMRYDAYVSAGYDDGEGGEETDDPDWLIPRNYSFCTRVPYDTPPEDLQRLAEIIADRLGEALPGGHWKSTAEEMSWISLDDIIPSGPETSRLCIHNVACWIGHECGDCEDAGRYVWLPGAVVGCGCGCTPTSTEVTG